MKIIIASDIHGSALYCKRLLEAYDKENGDRLLLLGDILYHGPRNDLPQGYAPKEVIAMLNGRKDEILCVRGNCDTEVDQMVLEFPILADYCLISEKDKMIFATHGHIYNTENPPKLKKGDVLLHGHTHIPVKTDFDGKVYINPGSVSIPKENSPHSYIVFENRKFTWKSLEGKAYMEYEI